MIDYSTVDDLICDGLLSDSEIAQQTGIDVRTVEQRRTVLSKVIASSKSAKPIKDLIAQHMKAAQTARLAIAEIGNDLLEHIRYSTANSEGLTADEISKHTNSLVKLDGLLRVSGDETVDAILRIVEADILPQATSAKIITAFESHHEKLRRETRKILHAVPTSDEQLNLLG